MRGVFITTCVFFYCSFAASSRCFQALGKPLAKKVSLDKNTVGKNTQLNDITKLLIGFEYVTYSIDLVS